MPKVCCDTLLLAYPEILLVLTFVVVSHGIFWRGYFAPPWPSETPGGGNYPLWLRPVSYANGTAAMQSNDLSSDNFCDELAPDGAASFIHAGRGNYCSQTNTTKCCKPRQSVVTAVKK